MPARGENRGAKYVSNGPCHSHSLSCWESNLVFIPCFDRSRAENHPLSGALQVCIHLSSDTPGPPTSASPYRSEGVGCVQKIWTRPYSIRRCYPLLGGRKNTP